MKITDVQIITPNVHTDYRGNLWTLWQGTNEYNHDKVSTSRKNVIRGIHGDFYHLILPNPIACTLEN